MKRQKWTEGSIVKIGMGGDQYCYGVLLKKPFIAFLDGYYGPVEEITEATLSKAKILFIFHYQVKNLRL